MTIENAMSSATEATDDSGNDSSTVQEPVHFKGRINTEVFDPILRHMTEIVDEYTVVINSHGWHIRVVNNTNVVQFDVRLSNENWEHYDAIQQGVVGVSQKSMEEMISFIDATDGNAHISVEDNKLVMSDGQKLFTDTALIDPDRIRARPDKLGLEETSRVTFNTEDEGMWDFKKWVRSVSHGGRDVVQVMASDIGIGFNPDTNYKGNQTDDPYFDFNVNHEGDAVMSWCSLEWFYKFFKKPLKSQLTATDYTFIFYVNDTATTIEKEYENGCKLRMTVAPRVNRR